MSKVTRKCKGELTADPCTVPAAQHQNNDWLNKKHIKLVMDASYFTPTDA